ncbi:4Fe-4S dicluster domain-containing protein [bacterium]|nr:4Fe-4S dicluster domain-containing protein [bacterium]
MRQFNPGKDKLVIDSKELQKLFDVLLRHGYTTIGPTLKDQAIILDEISSIDQLPVGWTDEQGAGTYRLKKRNDDAWFGYVITPTSWKTYLHSPAVKFWSAKRNGKEFDVEEDKTEPLKFAFIGVRACELHAIAIQDKVFYGKDFQDAAYVQKRERAFIVAVNCSVAGHNCFCASMNTGPKAANHFDIALTEIIDGTHHFFVAETGSDLGVEILHEVSNTSANEEQVQQAEQVVVKTESQITKILDTTDLKNMLNRNLENRIWDSIGKLCLSCANCTMVCPTCFCTNVEDVTDLSGDHAERWRKWDSCFTVRFSYIHGGSIRNSAKSRYRQWMTHKLSNWVDQFGSFGCTGCGRCITWCPVGIDLTEEAATIRQGEKRVAVEDEL